MCVNWLEAKRDLDIVKDKVSYFHWDLVDGFFAPDFTMGSSIINMIIHTNNIITSNVYY